MRDQQGVLAVVVGIIAGAVAPRDGRGAKHLRPFGPARVCAGRCPTPGVIGVNLGDHDVTVAESDAYLKALDAASDRGGVRALAKSVQGRYLNYAIVGHPDRVRPMRACARSGPRPSG